MAATGYTPIYLYYSSTATNAPVAGNLGYGELAINITDGYLFYKDNANAIQKIGYKLVPIANGGTNNTTFTAKSGNVAGLVFYDGTKLTNDATVADAGYDTSTNTLIGANLSTPGSLTFSSTAQRIYADFSNATISNRLAFQSSTTNGATQITAMPNGTATQSQYTAINGTDQNNASGVQIRANATAAALTSYNTGTGASLPLQLVVGGVTGLSIDTTNKDVTINTGNVVIATSGKGITTGSAIPLGFGTNGNTTQATLFSSGGVSIGNTTDPGATNLSVTGTVTMGTPLAITSGGTGSAAMPSFRTSCASQTFTTGTETKVQFNNGSGTSQWNIGGYFDGANNRFLPLVAGYYFIKAQLFWGSSTSGRDEIAIFKNGSVYDYTLEPGSNILGGQTHQVSATVYCNGSTDYIEIYATQNSGGNVLINTSLELTNFEGHWVTGRIMNLYDKIMKLYPALTVEDFNIPDRKIWLRNDSDGRGDYICEWNHPDYTKPTQQQLDALDAKE